MTTHFRYLLNVYLFLSLNLTTELPREVISLSGQDVESGQQQGSVFGRVAEGLELIFVCKKEVVVYSAGQKSCNIYHRWNNCPSPQNKEGKVHDSILD